MNTDIRRETIELPTYVVKPENPNPVFGEHFGACPYPYRLQDKLTSQCVTVKYESVVLENQYLRLTFLPDFGCRLYSAWDKLLGREIFHRNHSIKPALIAIRGAWFSGGIEYNFPIGHSVYTYSRIPFTMKQNRDGSACMVFGLTEQMSGLRFVVEVRLAPDEYRFSQRIRLYNPTSSPQRHYWWTNAAVPETPQTQLIYPMTKAVSSAHGGEFTWPMYEGTDLSWACNHRFAGDIFAVETYDDFLGVYHWDRACGVAHWARQDQLPARKVFSWGQDEMGRLWQRVLNEDAGDYLEIQAGRFATQSDFQPLMPQELVELEEYWIPVAKTDGFVKAHREGILNVSSDGRGTEIIFQGTTHFTGRVLVSNGTSETEKIINFAPGEVVRLVVDWRQDVTSVKVLDAAGNVLVAYNPHEREKARTPVPTAAKECPPPTSQAQRYGIACDHFRAGNYEEVLRMCEGDTDPLLNLIAAAARRRKGNNALDLVPPADPLWRHVQWECYFATCQTLDKQAHVNAAPRLAPESFQEDMDAAEWYFNLGMREEAAAILSCWKAAVPPEDPFFDALAFELGVPLPEKRRPDEIGIVNCFAHRETLITLLKERNDPVSQLHLGNMLYAKGLTDEAIRCWQKALSCGEYMPYRNLALAYWERIGDIQTAYNLMKRAADINPCDSDTLADLDELAELTGKYDQRVEIAQTILRNTPDDSRCLERAVRAFLEAGRLDEAVEIVTTRRFFVKELAYHTRILYVRALIERGARCFRQGKYFEAAQDFRQATEYPENLGVGKLHDSSDAQAFYLLGLALARMGELDEARQAWAKAADDVPVTGSEQAFYVGRAREQLRRPDSKEAFQCILPVIEADSEYAVARHAYLHGLHSLANGLDPSKYFATAQKIENKDPVKLHRYLEGLFYSRSEGRRIPIVVWWAIEPAIEKAAI